MYTLPRVARKTERPGEESALNTWAKRSLVGLAVAAVVLYFLLEDASDLAGPGRTALTMVHMGFERDRIVADLLKKKFEELNPDLYLNVIRTSVERKVDAMIAGGVAPDILYVKFDEAPYYLEGETMLDLTGFISDDDRLNLDDYYPEMLKPFTRDGRIYALPCHYTPFVVFYNKDLFDKYSVPYPPADGNWNWNDYRQKAIELTHDTDGDGKIDEFGIYFAWWQHGVETFIRQNGGSILSEDGERTMMSDERTVGALRFLYDLKFKDNAAPTVLTAPGQNPTRLFHQGKVAMYGPWGVFSVPDFRKITQFDWDVAPLPKGPTGIRAGIVFPYAYAISTQSKHPKEAYRLLRFLTAGEGARILAKSSLFIPCRRSIAESELFKDPNTKPESDDALLHDVANGYAFLPAFSTTRWKDVYYEINKEFNNLLNDGLHTPEQSCQLIDLIGNRILSDARKDVTRTPFFEWLKLPVAVGVATIVIVLFVRRRLRAKRSPLGPLGRKEERWGYLLISPWVIGFVCLTAGPILFSAVLSLCNWQSLSSLRTAQFVGFENYENLLSGRDHLFYRSLQVTAYYTALSVPLGVCGSLALALLMNVKARGIHLFRTIYYMPAVLPIVAVTVLWWYLFNPSSGLVNHVLGSMGIARTPNWLNSPHWAVPLLVSMGLWAMGGSMILYLAGLQGIPTALYEAAEIDGAGAWRKFRHVTLPMITPVLFFNIVMGIIGSFQVFSQAYVMYGGGGGPNDSALFYVLYLYRKAFEEFQLGYGCAMAWILFVIIFFFTVLIFKSSPMWVHYEGLKERGR